MKVILTRLRAGTPVSNFPLRDPSVEGVTENRPVVGKSFTMFGPPRDSGNFRMISTSPVELITEKDDLTIITTETGSVYELNITDE